MKIETITAAMNNTSSLSRLGRIQFADVELGPPLSSVSASCPHCEKDTHVVNAHSTRPHKWCMVVYCVFLTVRPTSGRDNCVA